MNPWGMYDHQPQLFQAVAVGVGVWLLRRRGISDTAPLAVTAAVAWAAVGVLDWLVYAFGYQFARLQASDVKQHQATLEWLRLVCVLLGVVALARRGRAPPS